MLCQMNKFYIPVILNPKKYKNNEIYFKKGI